jgi:hypothetical protein
MSNSRIRELGNFEQWQKRLRFRLTPKQQRACKTLERLGQRFMVDYGYENAQEILRVMLRNAQRRRRCNA